MTKFCACQVLRMIYLHIGLKCKQLGLKNKSPSHPHSDLHHLLLEPPKYWRLWWKGLESFKRLNRTPVYCGSEGNTKAFTRSFLNFHFYWILRAGHFVPVDQPCVALSMVANITNSPAKL